MSGLRGEQKPNSFTGSEGIVWLKQHLSGGCKRYSEDVLAAAKAAGFGRNIVYDAKTEDGTIRASNKGEFRGKWYWWIEAPAVQPEPLAE